jgi:hypothetical protein
MRSLTRHGKLARLDLDFVPDFDEQLAGVVDKPACACLTQDDVSGATPDSVIERHRDRLVQPAP